MATYQIEWKTSALRELKRIDRQVIPRIITAIENLKETPFPDGCRKLKGSEHTYRIRVGDYRVIYTLQEEKILLTIIRIRHRKEVYRK